MPRQPVPEPMEALLAAELPEGDGWQYEPKWDGFRCIARRDGDAIEMISRSGKPLGRYFPEVLEILSRTKEKRFIVDGELILPLADRLDFEALADASPSGREPHPETGCGNASAAHAVRRSRDWRQELRRTAAP